MKKILIIMLMFFLVIPVTNVFASEPYQDGFLDLVPFSISGSSGQYNSTTIKNFYDNDISTFTSIPKSTAQLAEHPIITFETPIDITSTYLKGTKIKITFYNSTGSVISSINPPEGITNSTFQGVKQVRVASTDTTFASLLYELDFYGPNMPQPTKEKVSNITETHTHNSIQLNWTNPTSTSFSGTIIKQNGVVITELSKEQSSYSIENLNENTTYNYEIYAKYSDSVNSDPISISITTDNAPLPPEPIGEIIDLTATATHERVDLSWVLPESENLKHVNIYRDIVVETSLIDALLGSRAYAAETKIFETNGTYFNDLTVSEQTTYEYTLTTTSTEGIESEGVTEQVTTPEKPDPVLDGGGYTKDTNGDFTYYWTSPTDGQVKVLVGGTDYKTVSAADQQIIIPKEEMKYTAFGDPDVTLIVVDPDGDESAPVKPPLNGVGSPDSLENINIPFSATDLLGSGMGLFLLIAPFVLLALAFIVVPKLRKIIIEAFTKKNNKEERNRRFASETKEQRETREKRERSEREERLTFKERSIGSGSNKQDVIVKVEKAPKERRERVERVPKERTRETRERKTSGRIPRAERGMN